MKERYIWNHKQQMARRNDRRNALFILPVSSDVLRAGAMVLASRAILAKFRGANGTKMECWHGSERAKVTRSSVSSDHGVKQLEDGNIVYGDLFLETRRRVRERLESARCSRVLRRSYFMQSSLGIFERYDQSFGSRAFEKVCRGRKNVSSREEERGHWNMALRIIIPRYTRV